MNENPVATVFSAGKKFLLGRSKHSSTSYFGGLGYDQVFSGPRYGPRSLHHVLTLNHVAFKIPNSKFGFKVSLYYGICFDGCEIDWKRTATGGIEITKIIPKKSQKDYPYPGYPDLLPYFPLEIIEDSEIASTEVEEEIYNTSWAVS